MPDHAFSLPERQAVYRAIYERRDMRHFCGGTVADELLARLLSAAHHAPSVGFMQPWRFIRVRNSALRQEVHALIEQERVLTAQALGERQDDFMKLKVQGVLDAAEVLVVALPPGREAHVFGRRTLPEMDLASAACAIQNLWLAARAEGLGMGWVSIFCPLRLGQLLQMPEGSKPVAVLCLGPVADFYDQPMLQAEKWARRTALSDLVFEDGWGPGAPLSPVAGSLHDSLPPH
ncbi:MAG: 5,6-dimethylbenzimidazole synthase [Polaromonas sp.]|nr:5,6-dimethylbenzimidazole synthase [Polaromonas sp.]